MASSKAVRCWGEAEIRRSTSSVSSDCAPWALSDPTCRQQRPGSGIWAEGAALEAKERGLQHTLAQNPTEALDEERGCYQQLPQH